MCKNNREKDMIKRRKLALMITFALTALLAVTSVQALPRFDLHSYPAEIQLLGTMTLKEITTDSATNSEIPLDIDTNFTALVPFYINPGDYEAYFLGIAVASDDSIKFKGIALIPSLVTPGVHKGNFWVNFRIDKPESLADGIYVATGEMSIAISPVAPDTKVIWVHMKGMITSYNNSAALGGIVAHAKIGEWAKVHGFFTPQPIVEEAAEDYTFSFFAFRLVNATTVELNHDDDDLYISGHWDVYNVTLTYYDHDWTLKVEQLLEETEGELMVHLDGYVESDVALESETNERTSLSTAGTFTVDLNGLEPIAGTVIFYHLRYCLPIRYPTPMTDHNGDWKVNMLDVANVARSYGSTIGRPGYNFFLDVNFDFIINIVDLSSTAQAFGQEY